MAIVALPKAPPVVEGVINFRGTLVPVLDVRQRFTVPPAPLRPEQHFIIARACNRLVALRVDRVVDLIGVEQDAIESATIIAPGAEYVAGIAKLADGVLVIHDLERFLSLDEGKRIEGALAAASPRRAAPGGAQ